MARKVVDRRALREQNDAAEKQDVQTKAAKRTAKAADGADPKKPKRKSRAKVAKEVRLKAFWDVVNQSMKRVVRFEYSQRAEADKKAAELTVSQKTPHFVQPVKEVIQE